MPVREADATVADAPETAAELRERIRRLEDAVKALEAAAVDGTAESEAADEEQAPMPPGHNHPATTGAGDILSSPALLLRGFGDINLSGGQGPASFSLGGLDLFVTSRLSDHISVLSEMVIEAGDDNALSMDLERISVQFRVSPYLTVAAGRFHANIGFYNAAYHHGLWFQTAADRPRIFAFEDESGILPVHNVGVSLGGRLPSGSAGLSWIAEVGNGRRWVPGAEVVQNVADIDDRKSINVGVISRPTAVDGLQLGLSVLNDRLDIGSQAVGETITAAHVVVQRSDFEWLNEVVAIRHVPSLGGSAMTTGFYSQASRRFGVFQPFVRFDYLRVPDGDPVFRDIGVATGATKAPMIGLRFDVSAFAALKVQYGHQVGSGASVDRLTAQAAFTF